jgi:MOSC domain-containing protein YiiM
MPAVVLALFRSPALRAALERVPRLTLVANAGARGDYHARPNSRRQLLLMDAESLDALELAPGDVREQVTVRGLELYSLVFGSRLRVGAVVLEITAPCAPCERLDELRPGMREESRGRRGRFTRILEGGEIGEGDEIVVEASS